jgi:hypothetical protein
VARATTRTDAPAEPADLYAKEARRAIRERIARVVEVEAPVHEELLMRRVLTAWAIEKLTAKPRARLEEEIAALAAEGKALVRRGPFLWRPKEDPAAFARVRGAAADGATRDAEHLPPEEVAAALARVLAQNLSLERGDLAKEAARIFGYARAGRAFLERVEEGIAALEARGALEVEEARLHWRGG